MLEEAAAFKVKRIEVLPGKRLSLQRHRRRSEHWVVVLGEGIVTRDADELVIGPGDSVDIPEGAAHRMANPGESLLVFVEVQRGDYLGEDDIERLQDDFGRAEAPADAPADERPPGTPTSQTATSSSLGS